MTSRETLEKRIAKMARSAARLVIELRRAGDAAGAARLEELAMDVADHMRKENR